MASLTAHTQGSSIRTCPFLPFPPSVIHTKLNGLVLSSIWFDIALAAYVSTHLLEKALIINTRIGDVLYTQAYPDVSAQSRHFLIYFQGKTALISGTSAAAPTFAAVVTLLNDAMLSAGKPPLGFLNPLLYGAGAAGLNDITQGNNIGCGTLGFNVRFLFHPFIFLFYDLWLTCCWQFDCHDLWGVFV
jgi:hypothetical protein